MNNIKEMVEALIFTSGAPIEKKVIVESIPEMTTQELNKVIKELQKKYSEESGIYLVEFNGKVQFTSNPAYGDYVGDTLKPLKEQALSNALLEVLSTIAYKQPITKVELEYMRGGRSSEYAISALLQAGLIEAKGRKDTVGKPILYGTTDMFLKKFSLDTLDDLPDLVEVMEKIQLLYTPAQDTLFRARTITDENGEVIETQIEGDIEDDDDIFKDEELPDFLQDEDVMIIE
ncbi:MAG: SMC-Scp complex subunit ScpB [Clostridia bacterium]|nr:SMC-Scp complex subunit ScpB [Clostridia bacterium]